MIPKKIHYCWLSGEKIPKNIQNFINTWKHIMPEYEIVKWDSSRFDVNSNLFVKEAYQTKKWAFASDYIRLYALYNEGGIYLDVDVLVKKKFDEFLTADFFTGVEYHYDVVKNENTKELLNSDGTSKSHQTIKPGIGIQAAVLGSIRGHPFLRDCLDFYKDKHFILGEGKLFNNFIAPGIYALVAEKYGFRYVDEKQFLRENMLLLPSEVFAGNAFEEKNTSYAVHYCFGSWRDKPKISLLKKISMRIMRDLKRD